MTQSTNKNIPFKIKNKQENEMKILLHVKPLLADNRNGYKNIFSKLLGLCTKKEIWSLPYYFIL